MPSRNQPAEDPSFPSEGGERRWRPSQLQLSTRGRQRWNGICGDIVVDGAAAVGFIGYAVIFFIRNFTDAFLELGIGPNEGAGRDQIQEFSPTLFHYIGHLHIAVSGFIAATGVAVLFLVAYGVRRGELWAWVGATVALFWGCSWRFPTTTSTTSTRSGTWGSSTWRRRSSR